MINKRPLVELMIGALSAVIIIYLIETTMPIRLYQGLEEVGLNTRLE